MKIISLYLPQYHAIPENDLWWGKNYTEWDSLKRGRVLTDGQYQPRIPLNQNYYNLLDYTVLKWQVDLAQQYGIYGFCVYHYWFNGKLLLEKPMELYLKNMELDLPFFFCWANENWTNIWEGNTNDIKTLIAHRYDDPEDWRAHFNYLLPFFKDSRYMKEENKPIFVIYDPELIEFKHLSKMMKFWDRLAKESGFNGILFTYQSARAYKLMSKKKKRLFTYAFEYLPSIVEYDEKSIWTYKKQKIIGKITRQIRKINISLLDHKSKTFRSAAIKTIRNYDEDWSKALKRIPESDKLIPGAFTDWDNSPRRKEKGKVLLGANPQKFKQYLSEQIKRAKTVYKKDGIVLFAWNEWSEGGYLEPDERFGYGYLQAIKEALEENDEMPAHKNNTCIFKVEA